MIKNNYCSINSYLFCLDEMKDWLEDYKEEELVPLDDDREPRREYPFGDK